MMSHILVLVALSSIVALLCLRIALRRSPAPSIPQQSGGSVSFLFEGEELVDASPAGQRLMDGTDCDWPALANALRSRFPLFPTQPPQAGSDAVEVMAGTGDKAVARLTTEAGHVFVTVDDPMSSNPLLPVDFAKARRDAAQMAEVCKTAPNAAWRTSRAGALVWYNDAYLSVAQLTGGKPELGALPVMTIETSRTQTMRARASVLRHDRGTEAWFDVSATPTDDGYLFHATNIDAVMRAEVAQRNFVQTLAKTFAQLTTGLAVFDRHGQLAMFNPALIDMTRVSPEFLSSRPALQAFFDRLREARTMPEPKDYATWRQDVAKLIRAANSGVYQETWTLTNGQTYRVSGRPHPDGAIAFLFDDITAEMERSRSYRGELELSRSLFDTFDAGLIAFAHDGTLTLHNAAFRTMWGMDATQSFAEMTIVDCMKHWQAQSFPNPAWSDVRDFVLRSGGRARWDTIVEQKNGTRLSLAVMPAAGGGSLLRFEQLQQVDSRTSDAPLLADTA